jgi:hypothetical protein
VDGKAVVQIDPDFAQVIYRERYHVFLTPYGDSSGLFVAERTPTHFEVREQQGGASTVRFGYRIVAKRGDIGGERLAVVEVPEQFDRAKAPTERHAPKAPAATEAYLRGAEHKPPIDYTPDRYTR